LPEDRERRRGRFPGGAWGAPRAWLVAGLIACLPAAHGSALRIDEAPTGPLGLRAGLLQETGAELGIEAAIGLAREGRFAPGTEAVPAFGIAARPVWLHLAFDNPAGESVARRVVAGTAWIDRLDVYLVRDGGVVARWHAGDSDTRLQRPEPGLGYVFDHRFEPGRTDLFLRAATPDPLVLPVRLLVPGDARAHERWIHYSYGWLYGYLIALIAYNALLFAGLRARSYLHYSLYLGCFVVTNLAYTGHGYALLWTDWPGVQRYVILALMVLFGVAGLRFATVFLELDRLAPDTARTARLFSWAGLGLLGLAMLAGEQGIAALVAFSFVMAFTIAMVGLGLLGLRLRQESAHYFLAAALCAMVGAACTTLAVWGVLPFTTLAYRAVEVGVLLEATLLALALAYQIRLHRRARMTAEQLANTDPLTGLLNRRAFIEQGERLWSVARRKRRPMALVLLDLDRFKAINDVYGHAAGDHALEETARVLRDACRLGDLVGRWGGEEFILLLPETEIAQAMTFAERLRQRIAGRQPDIGGRVLQLSASLGVAGRESQGSLQALIADADAQLYQAKADGRDRVRGPGGPPAGRPG
jgi:diguanylate cyclase (GGDEF)-like protein